MVWHTRNDKAEKLLIIFQKQLKIQIPFVHIAIFLKQLKHVYCYNPRHEGSVYNFSEYILF
jgi:hypothetical protein